MAIKLKGKNVAKLKKAQKDKMEKTLKRMYKVREEDSTRIRILVEEKIKAHKEEIIKVEGYLESYSQKIQDLQDMKLKLEGAIISLQEILNNASESKPNS